MAVTTNGCVISVDYTKITDDVVHGIIATAFRNYFPTNGMPIENGYAIDFVGRPNRLKFGETEQAFDFVEMISFRLGRMYDSYFVHRQPFIYDKIKRHHHDPIPVQDVPKNFPFVHSSYRCYVFINMSIVPEECKGAFGYYKKNFPCEINSQGEITCIHLHGYDALQSFNKKMKDILGGEKYERLCTKVYTPLNM